MGRGARRSLGRGFGWLWASYAVSACGAWLAFDAFHLLAILVLHAGPLEVSALAAVGPAVGAVVALPLGPWVEFRRKRPVMAGMDLVRFAALLSVPLAYALGRLGLAQLLAVSVVVAAADIAFSSASGACLKALVRPEDLLVANGRFESTTWTATALGPPLGGLAMGVLGPAMTVLANAVSFLLSAVGIRAIGGQEPPPEPRPPRDGDPAGARPRPRARDVLDGWRFILADPALRPLFANTSLVNGLIMATAPLLAVLMVGHLGFAPWQYGLAFAAPCLGGLVGSRLAPRLVARYGRHRVLRVAGALRACWLPGLALVGPGTPGLALVMSLELGLIVCASVFNTVFSTYRLERTGSDRVVRVLSAWTVTHRAAIASMTAVWGLLAGVTGPRAAIVLAGLLSLATPLLLPRSEPEAANRDDGHDGDDGHGEGAEPPARAGA